MEQNRLLAGRYRLIEQIDSGGSSYIFKAKDERSGKIVAVKVLKPELTEDKEFIQRFKKEVHASLKLRHANIVRAYDAGVEDNLYYIVMDLIKGKTLKHLIKVNGPLPLKYVVSVAKKLCLALEYAHVKGFVHRDIKPHNILIDREGEPYITDFGIAHDMTQNTTIATEDMGGVMGSVHYFSPEQARGERVDRRTDIYSLGITMFEMLTGRVPFDADTSVTIALKHLNEPLPDISDYVEDVPQSICRIIQKATQKDKHFRYKSAFSMYEDLQRCLLEREGEYVKFVQYGGKKQENHQIVAEEEKSNRSRLSIRRLFLVIVVSVAVIASIVGIINYVINLNVAKPIPMPFVIGKEVSEAVSQLEQEGLVVSIARQHSTEPEGIVIAQKPDQGTQLEGGRNVEIIISSGQGDGIMPDVTNMEEKKAMALLEEAGIDLTARYEEAEGETPIGFVKKQQPDPGTKVQEGTDVYLWVKISPSENMLRMPDVEGINVETAVNKLVSSGFTKFFLHMVENTDAIEGTVQEQNPKKTKELPQDKPVNLTVVEYGNTIYHYSGKLTIEVPEETKNIKVGVQGKIGEEVVYFIVDDRAAKAGEMRIPLDISLRQNSEEQTLTRSVYYFFDDSAVNYEEVVFEKQES